MNWKKLIIGISIVNVFAWFMLEFWSKKYAGTNVSIGSTFLVIIQIIGYYIIAIVSRIQPPKEDPKPTPQNCIEHDWQQHKHIQHYEVCIKCGAERGKF